MATICDLNLQGKTVEIDYPCHWEYKVIIEKHVDIVVILKEVLGNREYKTLPSQESKKGTYVSHNTVVLVTSHEERQEIFVALKAHENVKFVL